MKEITLEYLREEAKLCHDAYKSLCKEAGDTGNTETWETAQLLLGQCIAYEQMIQYMRELPERQFQLERKKGTL